MSLLLDRLFGELPEDKSVDTKTFLDNVSTLPPFIDCLGSKVFSIIKSDINGNITKIRAVYVQDPAKYATLQAILEAERETYKDKWPKVGATLALMWLKRGLRFIQVLLQSLADGERDENNPNLISVNITKAYEHALKKYHGWIVKNVFNHFIGIRGTALDWFKSHLTDGTLSGTTCAPYRSNFLKNLSKGEEVEEEECLANVRLFLVNYTATIDAIYEMYTNLNAELDYTV